MKTTKFNGQKYLNSLKDMSKFHRIFIFNGPPNSGKDTACDMMASFADLSNTAIHYRFKDHLYDLMQVVYDIQDRDYMMHLMTDRVLKETPCLAFNGKTPREALIHLSEQVIKPAFGKEYFGKILANKIQSYYNIFYSARCNVCVSDSGFVDEINPVVRLAKHLDIDVRLVRLYREGCSFKNDSRNYLNLIDLEQYNKLHLIEITNNGDTEQFKNRLYELYTTGK